MGNVMPYVKQNNIMTVVDNIFDEFMNRYHFNLYSDFLPTLSISDLEQYKFPRLNIDEYDDRVEVIATVSGYEKDQLNVEISDGYLCISAKKKAAENRKNGIRTLHQIHERAFTRSLYIGKDFKENDMTCHLKDGLLKITLPRVTPLEIEKTVKKLEITE